MRPFAHSSMILTLVLAVSIAGAHEPRERQNREASQPWERKAERRVEPRERAERPGTRKGEARSDDRRHAAPPPDTARPPRPPSYHKVRELPPQAQAVQHQGERYWFADGVWYAVHPGGYRVTRPPLGIVAPELPVFRTIVRQGGVTLYLVNEVYYRPLATGGYEVVAPPQPFAGTGAHPPLIQPRRGQSLDQQARDEYECHRWAVKQSGHDPLLSVGDNRQRAEDYRRAQAACLEVQGYTVQ